MVAKFGAASADIDASAAPDAPKFVERSSIEKEFESVGGDLDKFFFDERVEELIDTHYLIASPDGKRVAVSELGSVRVGLYMQEVQQQKLLIADADKIDISAPRYAEKREAILRKISPYSNLVEACWEKVWDKHLALLSSGSKTGLRDDSKTVNDIFLGEYNARNAAAEKPRRKTWAVLAGQFVASKSAPAAIVLTGSATGHVPNTLAVGLAAVATAHVVKQFGESAMFALVKRVQLAQPVSGPAGDASYKNLKRALAGGLGQKERTQIPERPSDFKSVREAKGLGTPDAGTTGIA